MFLTVLVSVLVTLYVLFSFGLYVFHYLVEEILDLPLIEPSTHSAFTKLVTNLLKNIIGQPQQSSSLENRISYETHHLDNESYEEFLATVVKRCQNKCFCSSDQSNKEPKSSALDKRQNAKEYFFGEKTLEDKWRTTHSDTSSSSSSEDWINSSFGSKKKLDKILVKIKHKIDDECSDTDNEEEENDLEDLDEFYQNSLSSYKSDDNWFLQRRYFHGTPSPVPVPMLVPNPSSESKVFIGDKPVDDTSELSEIESEDYEYYPQPPFKAPSLLVESKTVIGGYSKKEKEKWNHAIEMKNNPYSKENIEKRLKMSSYSSKSLFGSDYYARQAKSPSGGKIKFSEVNDVGSTPQENPRYNDFKEIENSSISNKFYKALPDSAPLGKTADDVFDHLKISQNDKDNIYNQNKLTEEKNASKKKVERFNDQNNFLTTIEVGASDSDQSLINSYDVKYAQIIIKTKNEDIKIPIKATGNGMSEPTKNMKEFKEKVPSTVQKVPVEASRNMENLKFDNSPKEFKERLRTVSTSNPYIFKRHASESDLLDTSFTTPKILLPKKDNTLIAKIYKNHRVRQFITSSRDDLSNGKIQEKQQNKFNLDVQQNYLDLYGKTNSDISFYDGSSSEHEFLSEKTENISYFSSEEDLLSTDLDAGYFKQDSISEERPVSRGSYCHSYQNTPTPQQFETKRFIYSSSEDLLNSCEELDSLHQKKDNTIVSKIYKDPKVRKTVLNERLFFSRNISENSLDEVQGLDNKTPLVHKTVQPLFVRHKSAEFVKRSDTQNKILNEIEHEKQLASKNNINNESDTDASDNNKIRRRYQKSPELQDIENKKLVHTILGTIFDTSKNQNLLKRIPSDKPDEIEVSVKDLRRKFENHDEKGNNVVSSLTARSLSKQIKESLRE